MVPIDSFYRTIFYSITYTLSILYQSHPFMSCFRVDMVSNLDPVSIIFALFNNYLAISAKHLDGSTINVYRNYDDFCIGSALKKLFFMDYGRWNHSVVEKLRTLTVVYCSFHQMLVLGTTL